MNKSDKEPIRTADLARESEGDRLDARERVINRADAYPSTDRAESLWDKTVKDERPAGVTVVNEQQARDDAARADAERRDRISPADSNEAAASAAEAHLFRETETSELSRRWSDIQASFVDQPRRAVELADSLVAETMQRLAHTFAATRENLEKQWDRGEKVTTEDLRVTLQRYRAFFDRLLSV
jgi:hypothetical protein